VAIPGHRLNRAQSNSHALKLDESEEVGTMLVLSPGDAAELLQPVEEALDEIALAIKRLVLV
jgi:hypothetical protein